MTKKISEVILTGVIPPPIYGDHLTTNPSKASKTVKLVKDILRVKEGLQIIAADGSCWIATHAGIKFYCEE